jgi:hypothetical protein
MTYMPDPTLDIDPSVATPITGNKPTARETVVALQYVQTKRTFEIQLTDLLMKPLIAKRRQ